MLCLSVQDAGQPGCPSIRDGLFWVTLVEGGEAVPTRPPLKPFTAAVPSVTSHMEMAVTAEAIVCRPPSSDLHLSELERERSLGPLHRGKLTPDGTRA